ncbi:MAG: glycosyltransferase family 2 protein [Planctomycetes bacterium]|nr:glycosyltransferase family 2 protein [Planctomycetota bacterium]
MTAHSVDPRQSPPAELSAAELDRVAVIVPAYNEEESLPHVLADLPPAGCVIVVDNGSTDATARVALNLGAVVADEPRRGYGSACLRGIRAIGELVSTGRPPPKVVVFLDADYSDYPELLPDLAAPIFAEEAQFVLGSRLLGRRERGAMPPQSVWGNRLACFLMRRLLGVRYTDLGPFRAIDYRALCDLGMVDRNFGWTVEMQIKAAQAGLRIREIPVPYRHRIGRSKISGTISGTIKAGAKILYTIAKYGRRGSGGTRRVNDP